jgi:hypothetical protein
MALPERWHALDPHPEQLRLLHSPARFRVVAAGRRSGKTERAKRRLVEACLDPPRVDRPTFVACAPTRDQAKRIFWQDLKDLSPRQWVADFRESDLTIRYRTGAQLIVVGLDKPQRAEGIAIDGAVLDEYAHCRPEAWSQSLRPALSTRGRPPGWCWFVGRPRGRNHFYTLWIAAKTTEAWDAFHWPSSAIIPALEIEAARRDLDPLTFRQEYEADFISFDGLAYYQWDANVHLRQLEYRSALPLVFCFDFNVDPGVAAVVQEQDHQTTYDACPSCRHAAPIQSSQACRACGGLAPTLQTTCVIGEVHIPKNSNTPAVCNRLAHDWGHHKGPVYVYGDATGGARKSSQTEGADWDQVRAYLRPHFPDIHWRVAKANPPERDRINCVNTRLKSADGTVRFALDPQKAPNVVRDFEGVVLLDGGSGELDKKSSPMLSHLTDALGYYMHERHPIGGHRMVVV